MSEVETMQQRVWRVVWANDVVDAPFSSAEEARQHAALVIRISGLRAKARTTEDGLLRYVIQYRTVKMTTEISDWEAIP